MEGLDSAVLRANAPEASGASRRLPARGKTCLSGMETIGLLSLHRAEMVQKHSREMLAALSIGFQEPPVFKIKKHLYPQSLGAREYSWKNSSRFIVSMPAWVMN